MSGIPESERDPQKRFFSKVDASGPCWEWLGAKNHGYGMFRSGGRMVAAHIWAREFLVGEREPGLDLDHLCRNRACCNPDHLEPVTRYVNLLRGAQGHARKTECKRGHALTEDNVYRYGSKRVCKTCVAIRGTERQARLKL